MSWNYRVIRTPNDEYYSIHEVFYDKQTGEIEYWSVEPIDAGGESPYTLKLDLEYMLEAFKKPILIEQNEKLVEYESK